MAVNKKAATIDDPGDLRVKPRSPFWVEVQQRSSPNERWSSAALMDVSARRYCHRAIFLHGAGKQAREVPFRSQRLRGTKDDDGFAR